MRKLREPPGSWRGVSSMNSSSIPAEFMLTNVAVVHMLAVLRRCCKDGQFEQAVGVALEGRRLDKLEEVVGRSTNAAATLAYALRVCQQLVINRDFRQQVG